LRGTSLEAVVSSGLPDCTASYPITNVEVCSNLHRQVGNGVPGYKVLPPIFRIEEIIGNSFLRNISNVLPEFTALHSIFSLAEDGVNVVHRKYVMERFKGVNFNSVAKSVYIYDLFSFL
jgi:hypothetical protein